MGDAKLNLERMSLNKWEMHKALHDIHLPYVRFPNTLLATADNLITFADRYTHVYVKPVSTWGGHQISRIAKKQTPKSDTSEIKPRPHSYVWEQPGQSRLLVPNKAVLLNRFISLYQNTPCIVQRGLPFRRYQGRTFDIRLLLQRDLDETWAIGGTVVRVGGKDSIVSNVEISGGRVLDTRSLYKALNIPISVRKNIERKLNHSGLAICRALDKYHTFDEVGIDFGLDKQNTLWVIEVNTNDALGAPSLDLFKHLPDKHIYRKVSKMRSNYQLHTAQRLLRDLF